MSLLKKKKQGPCPEAPHLPPDELLRTLWPRHIPVGTAKAAQVLMTDRDPTKKNRWSVPKLDHRPSYFSVPSPCLPPHLQEEYIPDYFQISVSLKYFPHLFLWVFFFFSSLGQSVPATHRWTIHQWNSSDVLSSFPTGVGHQSSICSHLVSYILRIHSDLFSFFLRDHSTDKKVWGWRKKKKTRKARLIQNL